MGLFPAARMTDNHDCPAVTAGVAHVGGPILPPCMPTVLVNGLAQARATDKAQCTGPTDVIVTGAATVFVGGKPATRVTEKTMHGGVIPPPCSPDVFIGGPSTGVTIGSPAKAEAACKALSAGRAGGATAQSFGNCGLESARMIINEMTGANLGEKALFDWARETVHTEVLAKGAEHLLGTPLAATKYEKDAAGNFITDDAGNKVVDGWRSGGSRPADRVAIFNEAGVESTWEQPTMENVTQGISQDQGVISTQDYALWSESGSSGTHAVNATGATYDAEGNLTAIHVADTGDGACGKVVPASTFANSLDTGTLLNVTKAAAWK